MKEDDDEEELPSPDELTPLSQTLITPHLALAFDIPIINNNHHHHHPQFHNHHHHHIPIPAPPLPPPQNQPNSAEFDSSGTGSSGGGVRVGVIGEGGGGVEVLEPARTLKRPRLVWTPQLHKRFVDAVAHLGIKNAVPKTIMQLMSVDGLTRENVASHLQKYRLYLKRMQAGAGNGDDPATDHLFASAPVPAHFLSQNGPYVAPTPAVVTAAAGQMNPVQYYSHHHHHHHHSNYYDQRQMGQQFGLVANGGYENPFIVRGGQGGGPMMNGGIGHQSLAGGFVDNREKGTDSGRRVLTLFPTRDD